MIRRRQGTVPCLLAIRLYGADGTMGPAGFVLFFVVAFVTGCIVGLANGLLVAKVKVPPILATLGINELLTGLSIVMTGGAAVSTFPKQFCDAFSTNIGGVSPNGGKGRMSGVITALILLKLIESGIRRFRSVSDYYVTLIWGAVLLLALVLDYMSTKGRKAKA